MPALIQYTSISLEYSASNGVILCFAYGTLVMCPENTQWWLNWKKKRTDSTGPKRGQGTCSKTGLYAGSSNVTNMFVFALKTEMLSSSLLFLPMFDYLYSAYAAARKITIRQTARICPIAIFCVNIGLKPNRKRHTLCFIIITLIF